MQPADAESSPRCVVWVAGERWTQRGGLGPGIPGRLGRATPGPPHPQALCPRLSQRHQDDPCLSTVQTGKLRLRDYLAFTSTPAKNLSLPWAFSRKQNFPRPQHVLECFWSPHSTLESTCSPSVVGLGMLADLTVCDLQVPQRNGLAWRALGLMHLNCTMEPTWALYSLQGPGARRSSGHKCSGASVPGLWGQNCE